MAGIPELLPTILERGIGVLLVLVLTVFLVTLARNGARILAETYTKPVADTVARTLANWLVVVAAVAMSRWTPGAAEALKVQLEHLDCYERDGRRGFKLLRQAVDFALRMRTTAADEQTTLAKRKAEKREDTAITGSFDLTLDGVTSSASGTTGNLEVFPSGSLKRGTSIRVGRAVETGIALPIRPVGGRPPGQE